MSRCYCSLVPCSSNVQIPCLSHSVMMLMIATMMLMIVTTIPPISTGKGDTASKSFFHLDYSLSLPVSINNFNLGYPQPSHEQPKLIKFYFLSIYKAERRIIYSSAPYLFFSSNKPVLPLHALPFPHRLTIQRKYIHRILFHLMLPIYLPNI